MATVLVLQKLHCHPDGQVGCELLVSFGALGMALSLKETLSRLLP